MGPLLGVPENDGPDTATIPLLATGLGRDTKLGQAVGDFIEAEPVLAEGLNGLDHPRLDGARDAPTVDDDGSVGSPALTRSEAPRQRRGMLALVSARRTAALEHKSSFAIWAREARSATYFWWSTLESRHRRCSGKSMMSESWGMEHKSSVCGAISPPERQVGADQKTARP